MKRDAPDDRCATCGKTGACSCAPEEDAPGTIPDEDVREEIERLID